MRMLLPLHVGCLTATGSSLACGSADEDAVPARTQVIIRKNLASRLRWIV